MTWWTLEPGCGVLELSGPIELIVYFGDGQTRAVWLWSESGRMVGWAVVGEA